MPKTANAVRVNCSTTGTGLTLTLGTALTGCTTLAAEVTAGRIVAGDILSCTIDDGTGRELTTATVGAGGTTITRAATPVFSTNAGAVLSLSGSATVSFGPLASDLMTPDLFGTPAAPQSGLVRLGESALAGCDWPSWRSAQMPERFVQPLLGRTKFYGFQGYQAFLVFLGMGSGTITNSAIGGAPIGNSNYFLRQMRSLMASAATTNSIVSLYPNASRNLFVGDGSGRGGFVCVFRFGFSDTVSGARAFIGLTGSGAAPTNVLPATIGGGPGLTNVIGLAQIDGSTNLFVVYGGSSAQPPIDLGVNFPANTSTTDFYELWLYSDPNDNTQVRYLVNRWSGATTAISNTTSGTLSNSNPSVTMPATTTNLGPAFWRTNNTTAAAVSLEIGSFYCWSE